MSISFTRSSYHPLSQQELQEISDLVATEKQTISNHTLNEKITRYFNGHHRIVFELKQFPSHIIKIDSSSNAKLYPDILKCQKLIQQKGWMRCVVPEVQIIKKGEGEQIIWIEQKLEGSYSSGEAKEISEKEFEKFGEDPSLLMKWNEIFSQAAEFIAATGYSDVDWRNLLLMKESLGFIDFESNAVFSNNPRETGFGLFRLLKMAPLESFSSILQVVEKKGLQGHLFYYANQSQGFYQKGFRQEETTYEEALSLLREIRTEELAFTSGLRQRHEGKTEIQIHQDILNGYPENSIERDLLEQFNAKSNYDKHDLIGCRRLYLQPFLSHHEKIYDEKDLIQALEQLKKEGVIFSWNLQTFYQKESTELEIYF